MWNDRQNLPPILNPDIDLVRTGTVRWAACSDGLSNTLLASEVARGPIDKLADRTRVSDCYMVAGFTRDLSPSAAVAACDAIDQAAPENSHSMGWFLEIQRI